MSVHSVSTSAVSVTDNLNLTVLFSFHLFIFVKSTKDTGEPLVTLVSRLVHQY
jgi:hypothetical protein